MKIYDLSTAARYALSLKSQIFRESLSNANFCRTPFIMFFFSQQKTFKNPFPIVFLCGVSFVKNRSKSDKRHVLKEYLKSQGCCPIILEDYVLLGNGKGPSPGYADINIKNLNDAELAVALVADLVIILHESYSTAAEWSLFASNDHIKDRVCVLYPDSLIAEDKHVSGYLKHALEDITKNVEAIFPAASRSYKFDQQYDILTYFPDNKIDSYTKNIVNKFLHDNCKADHFELVKCHYGLKPLEGYASYQIDEMERKIFFVCEAQFFKCEFISMFSKTINRGILKETDSFNEFRDTSARFFVDILRNTIQRKETIDISNFQVDIQINGINPRLSFKHLVSIMLYVFHTLEWIKLDGNNHVSLTKSTIERPGFSNYYEKYQCLLAQETHDSSWRILK